MTQSAASKQQSGCLRRLAFWFSMMLACLMGLAVYFIVQPQDLSDLGGYGEDPAEVPVRDLKEVLRQSIERGHVVTLSEREINLWLGKHLVMEEDGILSDKMSLRRVWIRLEQGVAEVIMEREVFGRTVTVSMWVQIGQSQMAKGMRKEVTLHGGRFLEGGPNLYRGGRFGRLVVPQGYLYLVKSAYEQLAEACSEEIHLAFEEMVGVEIKEDRLVLNPRPAEDVGGLDDFE